MLELEIILSRHPSSPFCQVHLTLPRLSLLPLLLRVPGRCCCPPSVRLAAGRLVVVVVGGVVVVVLALVLALAGWLAVVV